MAVAKYIARIAGRLQQVVATVVSAGAADDGKIVALDANGRLDSSLLPVGIGADTKSIQASETLSAGNVVNVWADVGGARVRKADSSSVGKEGQGFVLATVSAGDTALVYFEGRIIGLTGLVPGTAYYLGSDPGTITDVPLSGAGVVDQYIGTAVSETELNFEPEERGVVLA